MNQKTAKTVGDLLISRHTGPPEVYPPVGKSLVAPGRAGRYPSPVLHIVFATSPPIRLSSWSPFTLQSDLPFQPPLLRPSYSPNCLPFLASYPHALPALPSFSRHALLIRISASHQPTLLSSPFFPPGETHTHTQNH